MPDVCLRFSNIIAMLVAVLIAFGAAPSALAQNQPSTAAKGAQTGITGHKVAIQVNENDPRVMNLALNNVSNIVEYYKAKGESIQVEVVTYGPGLHMLRSDSSPVKSRIAQMSLEMPQLSFAACANTQTNMSRQEGKDVPLLTEARVVPSGVVRLLELQESGFAYIRP